ncbi:Kelch-like protein 12 [Intoshia linei]|uniref:Kelch-like protein 12 n=1 Tax=Intoshia linei TaxID=1819745 RepID=A0A177B5H8_9BILA|nr:Kelch-like protein 12 [Intoshia linei]
MGKLKRNGVLNGENYNEKSITIYNVSTILKFADRLICPELIKICSKYIFINLYKNFQHFYIVCNDFQHLGLMEKMYSFFKYEFDCHLFIEVEDTLQSIPIKRNYNNEILNSRKSNQLIILQYLSFDFIYKLLCDDLLDVLSEESILKAIVIWLNYQPFNRKRYIPQLLNCIRLSRLNSNDLYILFFNNFYNSNPIINRYLVDQFYSNWCKYHALPTGGYNGEECLSTLYWYNLDLFKMEKLANMQVARCYVSVVYLGEHIYVMGGYNSNDWLKSVEKYNINTNTWSYCTSMNYVRSDAAAVVYTNKIYVCGGYNGTSILNLVEFYNPKQDKWLNFSKMNDKRSGFSLCLYNETLYAIGGTNSNGFGGNYINKSVEYFCKKLNKWIYSGFINERRCNFAATVFKKSIYVIGDYDGQDPISTVEKFSIETNCWINVCNTINPKTASNVCIVSSVFFNDVTSIMNRD